MRSQTLMHRYERKLENRFSLANHKCEHEFDFISVRQPVSSGLRLLHAGPETLLGGNWGQVSIMSGLVSLNLFPQSLFSNQRQKQLIRFRGTLHKYGVFTAIKERPAKERRERERWVVGPCPHCQGRNTHTHARTCVCAFPGDTVPYFLCFS